MEDTASMFADCPSGGCRCSRGCCAAHHLARPFKDLYQRLCRKSPTPGQPGVLFTDRAQQPVTHHILRLRMLSSLASRL